jgi:tetratricopeptide (TPR) repeat protein
VKALAVILSLVSCLGWAKPDPLAATAEYYFSRNDYTQALRLWNEVLTKDPANDLAAGRVAELLLFFEGRRSARDGLARHLAARGDAIPREARRLLLERWRAIQSSFLTEEGQSLYLQARERETQGDCAAALALVARAIVLEKGHLDLLKFRARCEMKTENLSGHYESLKLAHAEYPYDSALQEDLAEAHLRFQQPQRVVEMWQPVTDPIPARKRLALVFAFLDTGEEARAATLLVRPPDAKKDTEAAWTFLYGALAARRGSVSEAVHYWETFLAQIKKQPPSSFDPFRLSDRAAEVQAWIARKAPPKSGPPVTKNVSE